MTDQRCSVCRQTMERPSKYGICSRYLGCRLAYHRAESNQRNREQRNSKGRKCKRCGGPVGDKSKSGICGANAECRASIQRKASVKRSESVFTETVSRSALKAVRVVDRVRIEPAGDDRWYVVVDGKRIGCGTAKAADAAAHAEREKLREAAKLVY